MKTIKNWEKKKKKTLQKLQRKCVKKGWNAVTLAKNGHAYFKCVQYNLTRDKVRENKNVHSIWIFER